MVWFDAIVIVLILGFMIAGFYFGMIRVLFGILSIYLGGLLAAIYYISASHSIPSDNWFLLFSFALIFLFATVAIAYLGRFFVAVVKPIYLTLTDKIIGIFVFTFVGFILMGFTYNMLKDFSPNCINKCKMNQSKILGFILKVDTGCYNILPRKCERSLDKLYPRKINRMDNAVEEQEVKIVEVTKTEITKTTKR
jgi:uncharacterized membrane protein required for colicin V production